MSRNKTSSEQNVQKLTMAEREAVDTENDDDRWFGRPTSKKVSNSRVHGGLAHPWCPWREPNMCLYFWKDALRVFPAETRLMVHRRRQVAVAVEVFGTREFLMVLLSELLTRRAIFSQLGPSSVGKLLERRQNNNKKRKKKKRKATKKAAEKKDHNENTTAKRNELTYLRMHGSNNTGQHGTARQNRPTLHRMVQYRSPAFSNFSVSSCLVLFFAVVLFRVIKCSVLFFSGLSCSSLFYSVLHWSALLCPAMLCSALLKSAPRSSLLLCLFSSTLLCSGLPRPTLRCYLLDCRALPYSVHFFPALFSPTFCVRSCSFVWMHVVGCSTWSKKI